MTTPHHLDSVREVCVVTERTLKKVKASASELAEEYGFRKGMVWQGNAYERKAARWMLYPVKRGSKELTCKLVSLPYGEETGRELFLEMTRTFSETIQDETAFENFVHIREDGKDITP